MVDRQVVVLADLADAALSVARKIQVHVSHGPEIINLSPLEGLVMRHVDRHPGISPSRIAADLGLKSSNTSAALRTLEGHGLVERRPDPTDGRAVQVHPTSLAERNLALIRAEWSSLLGALPVEVDDAVSALHALNALDRALDAV